MHIEGDPGTIPPYSIPLQPLTVVMFWMKIQIRVTDCVRTHRGICWVGSMAYACSHYSMKSFLIADVVSGHEGCVFSCAKYFTLTCEFIVYTYRPSSYK